MSRLATVHVLSLNCLNNQWNQSDFEGTSVKLIEWNYTLLSPVLTYKLMRLQQKENYDVIHSHLTHAQLHSALLSLLPLHCKWITTEHSNNNNRRDKGYLNIFDKWLYSRFDKVFSVSSSVQKNLLAWLGKSADNRFKVFPNGVDVAKIRKAKALDRMSYGYTSDDKLIIMVGRFEDAKDQMTLVRCLEYLPSSYKVILVGDGSLRAACEALTKELKLANRVFFAGAQSNVPSWLKMCDIYVQSSHWEGMPTSVMEAMAAELYVFGSKVSGNTDVLTNEAMFEHSNAKDLARLILTADSSFKKKQKEIITKYDMSALAQKLLAEY